MAPEALNEALATARRLMPNAPEAAAPFVSWCLMKAIKNLMNEDREGGELLLLLQWATLERETILPAFECANCKKRHISSGGLNLGAIVVYHVLDQYFLRRGDYAAAAQEFNRRFLVYNPKAGKEFAEVSDRVASVLVEEFKKILPDMKKTYREHR